MESFLVHFHIVPAPVRYEVRFLFVLLALHIVPLGEVEEQARNDRRTIGKRNIRPYPRFLNCAMHVCQTLAKTTGGTWLCAPVCVVVCVCRACVLLG